MNRFYKTVAEVGTKKESYQGVEYDESVARVTIETDDEGLHDWILDVLRDIDRDYNN